ncbi:MAG: hypothetical protein IMZ69_02820 [Spirochaetes bacterium]|nr:hypothetical protein [Spirochaetota bacterium]
MLDWYSAYLSVQARQREMAGAEEFGRRLAEARRPSRSPRKVVTLRHRLGAALIRAGRALQGASCKLPASSGT